MKRDQDKTKEQLINELAGLRQRLAELEVVDTERKKMEEALRENEEKLQRMFESATDGIVITDLNGNIMEMNEAAVRLHGSDSKEKLIGQSTFELIAERDRVRVMEILKSAKEDRQIRRNVEIAFLTEDGREYFAEVSSALLRDAAGNSAGFIAMFRDITERKQAEEKIQQQGRFLTNVLDSLSHPFCVIDVNDYTIKMANPAAKLGKLSANSTCYALTHKRDKPCGGVEYVCPLQEVKKTGKPVVVEHIHYDKDGNARNTEVHGYPIFDSEGNVIQMIEYILDITERKQAQENLQRRNEFIETIINNLPIGLAVNTIDDGIARYVNRKFEEIYGWPKENLVNVDEFFNHVYPDPVYRKEIKERILSDINSGDPSRMKWENIIATGKDGKKKIISAVNIPLIKQNLMISTAQDITERKQAEEQARMANERLQHLLSASPAVIYTAEPSDDYGATFVSENVTQITGYKAQEFIKNPSFWIDHVHPEDLQKVYDVVPRLSENLRGAYEYRFKHRNGNYIWIRDEMKLVRDEKGNPIEIVGYWADITERKQAEEALSHERDLMQALFENHPDFLYFKDREARFHRVSQHFCDFFGLSMEDIIGKTDLDLFPEEVAKKTYSEDLHIIKTGTPLINKEENASGVWVLTTKIPWFDKKGNIIGLFGISRDITERKRAEGRLQQSEENLKAYLESAPDGIYINDLKGTFLYGNKKAEEITGYKREELIGKSFLNLKILPRKHLAKAGKLLALNVMGKPTGPDEFEMIRKDGSHVWVEINTTPIKQQESTVVIGFVRDITERKKAEEKARELETLKEVDRLRSGLLANVSHELRTPLTSIKGFAATLLQSDVHWSEEDQRDFLQSIDEETERLIRLISDLLDMSCIEAGGLKLDKHNYQIAEVLDSVNSRLASLTEHHQLQVIVPSELPPVFVDQMRIGQVLSNLVENATKYSNEGSLITIEAQLAGDQIIISVTDKGQGIPAELLDKVFDRFYQDESIVSGRKSGIGLGLSICKGIIESHGGRIWVESKVDKGSKFSFNLPVGKGGEETA